jgi:phage protein U
MIIGQGVGSMILPQRPGATLRCSSLAELYAACGYWDDAGGARVPGTAKAGDTVICDFSGTVDRGATNNILYPPAGVWIKGPGKDALTIQGRLYSRGTGGVAAVTRIDGLTLDLAGRAAVPVAVGAASNYGGVILEDVSLVCEDFSVINSNPTAGGNNLTVHSRVDRSAITTLFKDCVISSANLDCISTKGENLSSVMYLWGCTASSPGGAANNNAATPHTGHGMVIIGGSYAGGAGKLPISSDTETTPLHLYNVTVTGGKVAGAWVANGCTIEAAGADGLSGPLSELKHTRITNVRANDLGYGVTVKSQSTGCVVSFLDVQGTGGSTALLFPSAPWAQVVSVDHVICEGIRRGVDLRSCLAGSAVTDCLLSCLGGSSGRYSVLGGSGRPATARNVVDQGYYELSLHASDVQRAIEAGELETARAAVQPLVQPAPDVAAVRVALLQAGGW